MGLISSGRRRKSKQARYDRLPNEADGIIRSEDTEAARGMSRAFTKRPGGAGDDERSDEERSDDDRHDDREEDQQDDQEEDRDEEPDTDEAPAAPAPAPAARVKNYITPAGLQRLRDERLFLLNRERPAVTQVVAWAASNGDRSENADYQYGKRRLRQIDRRIRFLTQRIDAAEVVDPETPRAGRAARHVFFGATVRFATADGTEREVSIVGADEVDLERRHISWVSPLARALLKSSPGDSVVLHAPGGTEHLEVLDVRYQRIPVEPFTEPLGAESAPKPRPGDRSGE